MSEERLFTHPRFAEIPDELVILRARQSFLDYICAVDPEFSVNWHHEIIANQLDLVATGKLFRLMVFLPPRHSKSRMISQCFPAYYLGRNLNKRIMGVTTDQDLGEINNKACQYIMDTDQHRSIFPEAVLPTGKVIVGGGRTNKTRRVNTFDIVGGAGSYTCKGAGANIMGRGFHLGLIDDIYSSYEQAVNQQHRDKVESWYGTDFYTRRMKDSAIVFLITRWHHADLPGKLLQKNADGWKVISFPAISEEVRDKADKRKRAGEALWKSMYNLDFLLQAKGTMPEFWWDALYQQKPQKEGGDVFSRKDFGRFDVKDGFVYVTRGNGKVDKFTASSCRFYMAVDPASSEAKTADFTAHAVGMVTPMNDLCLLEVGQHRINVTEFARHIFRIAQKYIPSFIIIEATGAHKALVENCRKIAGMPPIHTPDEYSAKNKFVRAHPAILKTHEHKVFVPQQNDWEKDFFDQLESFTGHPDDTGHDDMVDAFAYLVLKQPRLSATVNVDLKYDPNDIMSRLRPNEELRYRL